MAGGSQAADTWSAQLVRGNRPQSARAHAAVALVCGGAAHSALGPGTNRTFDTCPSLPAQLAQPRQQVGPGRQVGVAVPGDDGRAVAVSADHERVAPRRGAVDRKSVVEGKSGDLG